jgi:hypothetical protein
MTVVPAARWAPSRTPRRIRHANALRHHVVEHRRELVHRPNRHVFAGCSEFGLGHSETVRIERAPIGPHHVVQQPEEAIEIASVGSDPTRRQQMQTKEDVLGAGRRVCQRCDHRQHRHPTRRRVDRRTRAASTEDGHQACVRVLPPRRRARERASRAPRRAPASDSSTTPVDPSPPTSSVISAANPAFSPALITGYRTSRTLQPSPRFEYVAMPIA